MAQAAATYGCYHTCPAYDGDDPHVGGPVQSGSSNVFIENKMSCRVGDQMRCNSPSVDTVTKGSSSVFINGKAAARIGDTSAHGGRIVEGAASVSMG